MEEIVKTHSKGVCVCVCVCVYMYVLMGYCALFVSVFVYNEPLQNLFSIHEFNLFSLYYVDLHSEWLKVLASLRDELASLSEDSDAVRQFAVSIIEKIRPIKKGAI